MSGSAKMISNLTLVGVLMGLLIGCGSPQPQDILRKTQQVEEPEDQVVLTPESSNNTEDSGAEVVEPSAPVEQEQEPSPTPAPTPAPAPEPEVANPADPAGSEKVGGARPPRKPERYKKTPVDQDGIVTESVDVNSPSVLFTHPDFGLSIPIFYSRSGVVNAQSWTQDGKFLPYWYDMPIAKKPVVVFKVEAGSQKVVSKLEIKLFEVSSKKKDYAIQFVRRGMQLADGSYLIIGTEGIVPDRFRNLHEAYQVPFMIKTDQNLKVDKSFGKDGVFILEPYESSYYNSTYLTKVKERASGELELYFRVVIRDAAPVVGDWPPKCSRLVVSKKGRMIEGKSKYENIRCD